jgi:hypothetical protein
MAQEKPNYEVNDEFNSMAVKIVEKYSEKFNNIEVDKVCCVNVDKERKEKEGTADRIWKLKAVKMPEAIHNQYGWYVILHDKDWAEMSQKHKLALVSDVLHGLPNDLDNEGKVNPCDTKGYLSMFQTFGINYLDDPDIPDLLEDDVEWR